MSRVKLFTLIFIIGVILSVLVVLLLNIFDLFKTRSLDIKEFRICNLENSSGGLGNVYCGSIFPIETRELYTCGNLNTEDMSPEEFVNLRIYLYNENVGKPIYENQLDDKFSLGNFCRKIILPLDNSKGLYTIKIYYFRKIIASLQFSIE